MTDAPIYTEGQAFQKKRAVWQLGEGVVQSVVS